MLASRMLPKKAKVASLFLVECPLRGIGRAVVAL